MADAIMGSVVLRYLKRSPYFRRADAELATEPIMDVPVGEVVVGTYQNPSPWEQCQIVFTDVAMHLLDSEKRSEIRWSEIVDYETLDPSGNLDGVRLRTRDGIRFVRIAGAYGPDGKFRDAFNLAMVLRSLLGK
jgi:hypothetical protein